MKDIIPIINVVAGELALLLLFYPVYYLIGHTETTAMAILCKLWHIPMLGVVIVLGVVILNRKYR